MQADIMSVPDLIIFIYMCVTVFASISSVVLLSGLDEAEHTTNTEVNSNTANSTTSTSTSTAQSAVDVKQTDLKKSRSNTIQNINLFLMLNLSASAACAVLYWNRYSHSCTEIHTLNM